MIDASNVVVAYQGALPPFSTGAHRYFLLLFKQTQQFNTNAISQQDSRMFETRGCADFRDWCTKKGLGDPVGINGFASQWEEQVDKYHRLAGYLPPVNFRSPTQRLSVLQEALEGRRVAMVLTMKLEEAFPGVDIVTANPACPSLGLSIDFGDGNNTTESSPSVGASGSFTSKVLLASALAAPMSIKITMADPLEVLDSKRLFTLIMTDMDFPCREAGGTASQDYSNWVVVNIPGSNVTKGSVVAPYVAPFPPFASGRHRFLCSVYLQPTAFSTEKIQEAKAYFGPRTGLRFSQWANRNGLGPSPTALNAFYSEWDESVDARHRDMVPPYVPPNPKFYSPLQQREAQEREAAIALAAAKLAEEVEAARQKAEDEKRAIEAARQKAEDEERQAREAFAAAALEAQLKREREEKAAQEQAKKIAEQEALAKKKEAEQKQAAERKKKDEEERARLAAAILAEKEAKRIEGNIKKEQQALDKLRKEQELLEAQRLAHIKRQEEEDAMRLLAAEEERRRLQELLDIERADKLAIEAANELLQQGLPVGWEARKDASGRVVYIDHVNKLTRWDKPSPELLLQEEQAKLAEEDRLALVLERKQALEAMQVLAEQENKRVAAAAKLEEEDAQLRQWEQDNLKAQQLMQQQEEEESAAIQAAKEMEEERLRREILEEEERARSEIIAREQAIISHPTTPPPPPPESVTVEEEVGEDFKKPATLDSDPEMNALLERMNITSANVFRGQMMAKKMSNESIFKDRWVWIDSRNSTINWAKNQAEARSNKFKSMPVSETISTIVERISKPVRRASLIGALGGGSKGQPSISIVIHCSHADHLELQAPTRCT